VTRFRVVVLGARRLMRELITEALSADPEIEITNEAADETALATIAARRGADVVIVGQDQWNASEAFEALHLLRPSFKVLAITDDGRQAFLYELHPQETALGQLSSTGLLEAVRGADRAGE